MRLLMLISLIVVTLASNACAISDGKTCKAKICTNNSMLTVNEANSILHFTGAEVKSVKSSPVYGLYELLFEKNNKQGVVYVDYKQKYLIQGVVIDLNTKQQVIIHDID